MIHSELCSGCGGPLQLGVGFVFTTNYIFTANFIFSINFVIMRLRIQYTSGPSICVDMCYIHVHQLWGPHVLCFWARDRKSDRTDNREHRAVRRSHDR